MGRLLTFMSHVIKEGWASRVTGIGVDEDAAALVTSDGMATVIGRGSVSFVKILPGQVVSCVPEEPLETRFLNVHVIRVGSTFDIATWSGDPNPPLRVRVKDGAIDWVA